MIDPVSTAAHRLPHLTGSNLLTSVTTIVTELLHQKGAENGTSLRTNLFDGRRPPPRVQNPPMVMLARSRRPLDTNTEAAHLSPLGRANDTALRHPNDPGREKSE
jgi:hypothetical protein